MTLPKFRQIAADYFWGAASVTSRELAQILKAFGAELFFQASHNHTWFLQTNVTTQYAGGFYIFGATANDFAPALNFGTVDSPVSAHIMIVTGALAVDKVTIRVIGTSIDDDGTRTATDTDDIVVAAGTPANSYFESKKFIGQVSIETVGGTPIACNYGWAKYFDMNNTDFVITGFEALWESDSADAASDIELIVHQAVGWTYNAGAPPTVPIVLASRSGDLAPEDKHEVGPGAWKRSNISRRVYGSKAEGLLWRVTSGSTGVGSLSFRSLNLNTTMRKVSQGSLLE